MEALNLDPACPNSSTLSPGQGEMTPPAWEGAYSLAAGLPVGQKGEVESGDGRCPWLQPGQRARPIYIVAITSWAAQRPVSWQWHQVRENMEYFQTPELPPQLSSGHPESAPSRSPAQTPCFYSCSFPK